jgi:hypothetical protein
MITFYSIPNNNEKLLILTGFDIFDLGENMLNDKVVYFFWIT